MPIYRFVVLFKKPDPRSEGFLTDARGLGIKDLRRIHCQDLYFIEGQLSQEQLQQLALKLLTDPVTQTASWDELPSPVMDQEAGVFLVEITLRPGVTDPVAEQIVRAARELGFDGVDKAATGLRFLIEFDSLDSTKLSVSKSAHSSLLVEKLVKQLLANDVIQQWTLGEIMPTFPEAVASNGAVEIIPIRNLSEEELYSVSKDRRAALDLAEMQAIKAYYSRESRDPTDVEFETIAQTWSEHCAHKTFKAKVQVSDGSEVDSIIKTFIKAATDMINAPWVRSAFVDNAGIIDFDDEYEISFKVETHNHPSAIEPFGGANTGLGGVIRDVLGVSAKPVANTDILCFGPQDINPDLLPEGVLHPRRIQSGVVAGIQDYGNKIGIPTVNGAILYNEGYVANPLVFCGCVGIAPRGKHRKDPQLGDRVVVLGGRTGRDGLRGATFSSMTMDSVTGEVSGASVQIGAPITEKGLIDVILRARDLGLYNDITDCGAGGLSSAVGEMASRIGADVELLNVRLKYPGLAPWEIWLSEAQERMVMAVPAANIPALQNLSDTFDTELTDIGEFTGSNRLIVRYDGNIILDLANDFLYESIPQRQLNAQLNQKLPSDVDLDSEPWPLITDTKEILLELLSHPNISSKAATIRLYDHEVQGGTALKPLAGVEADAPSDAAVIKPAGTKGSRGIVLSNGINPEYGKHDPYNMAWAVVDEAIRNAVAVGANPARIAILDNFCWGNPNQPETMGTLVEAARGCHDAAVHYNTPYISGKDSLNNEYVGAGGKRYSIPPTLLISAIGIIDDVFQAVSMDLKQAGSALYLIGDFQPALGGSHWNLVTGNSAKGIPVPSHNAPAVYHAFHAAIKAGLVKSAHDLSEGGLAVAAAEMCIGGRLGINVTLIPDPAQETRILFGETNGCILVEIVPSAADDFEEQFAGLPLLKIGTVTAEPVLKLAGTEIPVPDLVRAFNQMSEY